MNDTIGFANNNRMVNIRHCLVNKANAVGNKVTNIAATATATATATAAAATATAATAAAAAAFAVKAWGSQRFDNGIAKSTITVAENNELVVIAHHHQRFAESS